MEIFEIVGPAFVTGLMIALCHAPFGIEVLKRGIIFIDLAVAQIAAVGFIFANLYFEIGFFNQIFAFLCAIFAGLFFHFVEKINPKNQEAIIGVSFVLAASMSILLVFNHPHGSEEVENILSGQMLYITWQDVLIRAPIYVFVFILWFAFFKKQIRILFYLLFALAITTSVQLVGVYVVFASLILPALAVSGKNYNHFLAFLCGIISIILGVISAIIFDLPAGPLIVLSYVIVALAIAYFPILKNEK